MTDQREDSTEAIASVVRRMQAQAARLRSRADGHDLAVAEAFNYWADEVLSALRAIQDGENRIALRSLGWKKRSERHTAMTPQDSTDVRLRCDTCEVLIISGSRIAGEPCPYAHCNGALRDAHDEIPKQTMTPPQDSPEARITRYDMVTNFRCGESIDELERADNGEWVRWEDVEGRLHEQAQEIERLNKALDCPSLLCPYEKRAEAAESALAAVKQDLEARRLRAYRTARIFEPSMDGYTAAIAVYEAAFGKEIVELTQGHTSPGGSPEGRSRTVPTVIIRPTIEQLRGIVSTLANFIWTKQLRPGEHLWTIPADPERDFDLLLSAAIDELETYRLGEVAESRTDKEDQ